MTCLATRFALGFVSIALLTLIGIFIAFLWPLLFLVFLGLPFASSAAINTLHVRSIRQDVARRTAVRPFGTGYY
jgi:hypothetical protein